MLSLKQVLIGPPLETTRLAVERLTKKKALAVFSSDALSSVAYATEEILLVLVPVLGAMAFKFSLPVAMVIVTLLLILTVSYRQTIMAYPSGGGAYIVAKDNLGVWPGLVAGASLLIDYVLTVAVSIAAGVAAITSALPVLYEHRIWLAILFIVIIALANMRGVRESGTLFAVPTYVFVFSIIFLIVVGLARYLIYGAPAAPVPPNPAGAGAPALTVFLLLRAFASGCAAVTGVEAISNGIPAFQQPESKNASITLLWMAVIMAFSFIGVTILARLYHVVPDLVHHETVVSSIARVVFNGKNGFYYLIQGATALILILAANTSFADFPRLASILAKDGYLPRMLSMRGDRLVFSNGIVMLSALAGLLIVIFEGSTHKLIPLYAVGVFISFTLSQSGMVLHWKRSGEKGWLGHAVVNGIGALMTATALLVIATTKFIHGAWMVILLIPVVVLVFSRIKRHYNDIADELDPDKITRVKELKPVIIVPVASINRVVMNTLAYAHSLTDNVKAVHVSTDQAQTAHFLKKWKQLGLEGEPVVLPSPYRSIFRPLVDYIDQIEAATGKDEMVTVLVPEFVTKKWWHNILHNQTGLMLRTMLLLRKDIVIASVPYHLSH